MFFAPVWQITEKVTLRLRYDFSLRDHLGAVVIVPGGNRTDTQHTGLIALDWQPLRALFISGALQRDRRRRTIEASILTPRRLAFLQGLTFNRERE